MLSQSFLWKNNQPDTARLTIYSNNAEKRYKKKRYKGKKVTKIPFQVSGESREFQKSRESREFQKSREENQMDKKCYGKKFEKIWV